MLKMKPEWRFDSPGPIAPGVSGAFSSLISRIAGQGSRKAVLEHFKERFAAAAGVPFGHSSSVSWAESDLDRLMTEASANAPLFIDAFYTGCLKLKERQPEIAVPDAARINRVLAENDAGYEIRGDELAATSAPQAVAAPARPPSLDHRAQDLVEQSLAKSALSLAQGDGRQAVQELLWLLETIATAFRGASTGNSTVQGKYFNTIIADLKRGGSHQKQILDWMMTLHGFLSSPTGGGVRHGLDLASGEAVQIDEARLYCNLIRSYVTYLAAAHARSRTHPLPPV